MILFTVSDPSKYELLINAIVESISNNPDMRENYEELINELNRSLTSRSTVQTVGDKLHRAGGESKGVLHTSQCGKEGFTGNPATSQRAVLPVPALMESSRGCKLHYQVSEQPAGYDYLRKARS